MASSPIVARARRLAALANRPPLSATSPARSQTEPAHGRSHTLHPFLSAFALASRLPVPAAAAAGTLPAQRFSLEQMLEVLEDALSHPQHALASEGNLLRWQLRTSLAFGQAGPPTPPLACPPPPPQPPLLDPRIVIAIPFVATERERLCGLLRRWQESRYAPCSEPSGAAPKVDLMLYSADVAGGAIDSWLLPLSGLLRGSERCFGRVLVRYANLSTEEQSYIGGWDNTGPNNLFYSLFFDEDVTGLGFNAIRTLPSTPHTPQISTHKGTSRLHPRPTHHAPWRARVVGSTHHPAGAGQDSQCVYVGSHPVGQDLPSCLRPPPLFTSQVHHDYDFMLWMETDMVPISSGWIQRVQEEASSPRGFWRKGPLQQPALDHGIVSTHHYHTNSAGLYRLGEPCFIALMRRVQADGPTAPHDVSTHLFLHNPRHFAIFQQYGHRFHYTDFVQNRLDEWTVEMARQVSPETVFVHGKLEKKSS